MKKFAALFLLLCTGLMFFTGCGDDAKTKTPDPAKTVKTP